MVKRQPSKLATRVRFPLPAPDTQLQPIRLMNSAIRTRITGLSLALLSVAASTLASSPPNCDKIAQDVRESVTKEPSKVLMIVEDALVISESCACEIVKAAITASKADKPMVKQIVQTAIAVAPKMSPVIIECANSVSPGTVAISDKAETASTNSGKDAKNVLPGGAEAIQPPKEKGSDYSGGIAAIRGVYLMAPAVGGFVSNDDNGGGKDDGGDKPGHGGDKPKPPHRRTVPDPLSPSEAECDCPQ